MKKAPTSYSAPVGDCVIKGKSGMSLGEILNDISASLFFDFRELNQRCKRGKEQLFKVFRGKFLKPFVEGSSLELL